MVDSEGNSYSRAAIEAHIEFVGEVSPVTGNRIRGGELVENRGLREAIDRLVPGVMTPPPDSAPKRFRFKRVCPEETRVACLCGAERWCPECAMVAFKLGAPENTWPEDVWRAVYGTDDTFKQNHRVRVGFFFYANGAWQSEDMFVKLMEPFCSAGVSRADIRFLFRSAERGMCPQGGRLYDTNDARRGGVDVLLSGRMKEAGRYTEAFVRKMESWDEYTYSLAVGGGEMPGNDFREAFMDSGQRCLDARAFAKCSLQL